MERVKFDGDVAVYTEELDGAFVGAIQASKPLTAEQPYYELEVIDGGTQSWIGVGVADSAYPLDKQPGWDQFSVGYHADDGSWYKAPIVDEMSKSGKPQAMPLTGKTFACQKGDRIGVGLEFDDRGKEPSMKPRRVYFAKNGQYLGSIFLEKQFHGSLYPTVGFNSPGAKAKINLKADSATVQLQHSAQSFGTNEYAIDIVKDMLKKGADVNKQDAAGRTALHLASAYGAAPIATLLLEQVRSPLMPPAPQFPAPAKSGHPILSCLCCFAAQAARVIGADSVRAVRRTIEEEARGVEARERSTGLPRHRHGPAPSHGLRKT
jgi:hypothetical protein